MDSFSVNQLPDQMVAYLAPQGLENILQDLLGRRVLAQLGSLFICDQLLPNLYWAQNIWHNPQMIPITSINDAARKLKSIQRNWCVYAYQLHRRSHLIQEQLPKLKNFPLTFPNDLPLNPSIGSWTLLSPQMMLVSPQCSSSFPNGEAHFIENKIDPPSRAYLKLWEALTILGKNPKPGDICLDLGSSPGGWSWVLAELGAKVISVDKSPLDPSLNNHPLISYIKTSAFALDPFAFPHLDWIVCDIICYPLKLFQFIQKWIIKFPNAQFICTLKFQGETDHQTTALFASIPNSKIIHLSHNKHELTWFRGF